jgi:hypothetical protein
MRPRNSFVVLALASFVAASPTYAQSLKNSRFTDPATLVQNKAVQDHLDLSEETRQKIFNIPILIRQNAEKEFFRVQKIEDPVEKEKQMQELKRKTMQAGVDALAKALEPGELKRLKQIALQMSDFQAFETDPVKYALGLTPEQLRTLGDVVKAGNKEMQDQIPQNVRGSGDMQKMWEVTKSARKNTMEKALAVLTPDQRKTWAGMVGEPFDFALERPGKDLIPREGGPKPATADEKASLAWLEKRIDEWVPQGQEKSFDQIGWVNELCKATQLAQKNNRGIFVFVVDGVLGTGRC